MTPESAQLLTRTTRRHAILVNALDGRCRAWTIVLGEAQVIVRAHVECFYFVAREVERPVVVVGFAFEELDLGAWHRTDRSVEAVSDSNVHVSSVEAFIARIQRHKVLKTNEQTNNGLNRNGADVLYYISSLPTSYCPKHLAASRCPCVS